MHLDPIRRFIGTILLLLAVAPAAAQTQSSGTTPADPPVLDDKQDLTGRAAWDKVVGNTLVGMVEGRAFAEFYGRDGTSKFRIDGKLSIGRWIVEGELICFEYPGDPRDCLRLTLTHGGNVVWSDGKGLIDTRGTLQPGNAENL